jgi:hypothetical protein
MALHVSFANSRMGTNRVATGKANQLPYRDFYRAQLSLCSRTRARLEQPLSHANKILPRR